MIFHSGCKCSPSGLPALVIPGEEQEVTCSWGGEGPRELGRGAAGGLQTHSISLVLCVAAAGHLRRTSKKPSASGGALQLLGGKKKAVVVCDKHMKRAVVVKKQERGG